MMSCKPSSLPVVYINNSMPDGVVIVSLLIRSRLNDEFRRENLGISESKVLIF